MKFIVLFPVLSNRKIVEKQSKTQITAYMVNTLFGKMVVKLNKSDSYLVLLHNQLCQKVNNLKMYYLAVSSGHKTRCSSSWCFLFRVSCRLLSIFHSELQSEASLRGSLTCLLAVWKHSLSYDLDHRITYKTVAACFPQREWKPPFFFET